MCLKEISYICKNGKKNHCNKLKVPQLQKPAKDNKPSGFWKMRKPQLIENLIKIKLVRNF